MSDFVYLIIVGKLFLDCFGSLSSMTQYHKMIGKKSSKKKNMLLFKFDFS